MKPYVWQQPTWQQLLKQCQQAKLPHAVLLYGEVGSESLVLAQALAALLLCKDAHDCACGVCRHCHLLACGNHPDLMLVAKQQDATQIKIEQVRAVIEMVNQKPQLANKQIIIIDDAELLTAAAANALLKTLEEPPGEVYFILLTQHLNLLLPTILSRCQKHALQLDETTMLPWLAEQLPQEKNLSTLLHIAGAKPGKVMQLVEEHYLDLSQRLVDSLMKLKAAQMQPLAIVATLDMNNRSALFLECMYKVILDLFYLKFNVQMACYHAHCLAAYQRLVADLDINDLNNLAGRLTSALGLFHADNHINMQLVFEDLLLEWYKVLNNE